jgi:hypothetical protein
MPYSVGERGSYGCSGYPVIKDGTSEVMGCHGSAAEAQNQITAINMSEAESSKKRLKSGVEGFTPASSGSSVLDGAEYEEKDTITNDGGIGIRNPQAWPGTRISEEERRRKKEQSTIWSGSFGNRVRQKSNYNDNTGDWFNAKPIPETSEFQNEVETRNNISREIGKEHMEIKEGDFVMGPTVDGMVFGRVEHIMWEGGTLGEAGTEYALESMPPENPAMSVRVFEVEENEMEATPYSIGMMYQDAQVVDVSSMTMEQENEMEMLAKAETYSPNDGMKSAARRAIKWREDGEATGAGTPVGWGRARDIVAGRSMSLSVVRRMFSFFSRHEVDKQADGFSAGEEGYPSNGRIMWDAWGGDAGFSWSRAIVERNREKSLFSDFGKDYTKTERLGEIFKADSVRVGQMVSWNSSGGRATGKVKRIITSGSYNVPDSDFVISGTEDNPAVVITLYRDGKPTDTTVAHRRSTLRAL